MLAANLSIDGLLLSDGTAFTEATLILQWLDHQGTLPAMMPADTKGIAAYGRVLGLLDGIAVWNRELRRPENEHSPSVVALNLTTRLCWLDNIRFKF